MDVTFPFRTAGCCLDRQPWGKSRAVCSEGNDTHGRTAHKRLIQCPKWKGPFLRAWATAWERWQGFAEAWLGSATEQDMRLVIHAEDPAVIPGDDPP